MWPQKFKKYNLLCWYEGDFRLGGGGLVVCRWGELGLGRRRNRRGDGRLRGHILTFSDGFTDGILSVIWTEKLTRHRTDLPFQIPRWFRRQCKRRTSHVTVRAVVLNPSEKITRQNLHVSDPSFFLNSETFSFVIQSVTTDRKFPLVVTDWSTDGKYSVGNYRLKYGWKSGRR